MSGNSAICIREENGEEKKVCWKLALNVVGVSLPSLSHSFHKNCGAMSGRALGKGPGDIGGTSLGSLWGYRWDLIGATLGTFFRKILGRFSGDRVLGFGARSHGKGSRG